MRLTCPLLSEHASVSHGFFTRRGGVSHGIYASLNCGLGSGDDLDKVHENRKRVASALGSETLSTLYQVHSPDVLTIDAPMPIEDRLEGDALVTATPGMAIGILTADCLPILLADPVKKVIGAAHAGWKGAFNGVIENTLVAMERLGANASNITASIGPAIAQGSYEVGAEFYERFILQDEANQLYFLHGAREGHYMYDLKSYAKDRLKAAGVARINMLANDTCFEENDFFSFRRATLRKEASYGRQVSAIMLKE